MHISINDDNITLKLNDDVKNEWHSSQSTGNVTVLSRSADSTHRLGFGSAGKQTTTTRQGTCRRHGNIFACNERIGMA